MSDRHNLSRFLEAQGDTHAQACAELAAGAKASHWMWWTFPQLAALGRSATAKRYGLADLAEARAYLAQPTLAQRLSEATEAALASGIDDPHAIFGRPDDAKLRSSLTLFLAADPGQATLRRALDRFFGGRGDPLTLTHLGLSDRAIAPPD